MGALNSQPNVHLEKELGLDFPEGEHFIGFENRNNICYANSILQALYYCEAFRESILNYKGHDNANENPISLLQNVFQEISNHKKKVGVISNKKFMSFVRKKNEMFQGDSHQDTQEFLIWLLNIIDETIQKSNKNKKDPAKTWLQKIFEGVTTTETKCLACNNVLKKNKIEFLSEILKENDKR